MKKTCIMLAVAALCGAGSAPVSAASAPTPIGQQGNWKAYTFKDKGDKVCFMSSEPKKQEGNFKKRGEVFFFVTHWGGANEKNVVSVSNGYAFKPNSTATVTIDGKSFALMTQGEMAWTTGQSMDDAITEAIQQGKELTVKGVSARGTATTDTYSLSGSTAVFKTLAKTCAKK